MPTQQRLWGDQERPPASPIKQSTERGEDRPVCWPIPDTCVELAFEDVHLVSEHHDLDVLVRLASANRDCESEEAAQAGIEE
jgi:hypothetical protein